jgi:hypothetical protein
MIAPFKEDMPISHLDGFRRVCADHKYAYVGTNTFAKYFSWVESCPLMPLPDTSYVKKKTFIISRNNPYRGLINWR